LELEVSSTDRQVDLVQEGFDCVLRLGAIRDETLIARRLASCAWSTPPVPLIWRAMASLDRWTISSVRTIGQFTFRPCWAQGPSDGNIRTPTATRRFSCPVRCMSIAPRPTKPLPRRPWPDSGPTHGDRRYLESGALVEIVPELRRRALDVSLVVAHRRNLSRRVRAFMKWIEDVLTPSLE